jgi:hypothetical protein
VIGKSNGKRRFGVKRLLLAASYALSLAAVAALVTGATFGFFSATTSSQPDGFAAGTLSLSNDTTGSCGVVSNLLPDGSTHTCTLQATYGGNVPAYLGLDVLIATKAGSGGSNLYKPTDPTNDLQIGIVDNQGSPVTYVKASPATDFGSSIPCPSAYSSFTTCYELTDLLVSQTPFTNTGAVTFTTSLKIPITSTTDYQGGSAEVALTAHAVQSGNNGAIGACMPGTVCTGSWS